MSKKIVLYGGGNMGEGILRGILKSEICAPENIAVVELSKPRCEYLNTTYEIKAENYLPKEIADADMVIIAVNPQHVRSVLENLKENISENVIILSIAAGIEVKVLEAGLGESRKIVRVMPNTLIQSGAGYSAVFTNQNIDSNDEEFVIQVLSALGQTMRLPENMFDTFTAFSCSGPLWMYKMAESLIDAGVYAGFSRQDARNIVVKNMLGVAKTLDQTGIHPAIKVDEMTSPGGVTIEGQRVLEEMGLAATLMNSVNAAVQKAKTIK